MDTLTQYRENIEELLRECARVPYAHGNIRLETIFDRELDRTY